MTPRRIILAALAVLAIVAAACQPPLPKSVPVPGRVAIAGDSITLQALYYGSGGMPAAGWDVQEKVGLGWRAIHAQPRVTADVADPTLSPNTLVAAFGHNYTGTDGFTAGDMNEVSAFVFLPHPATCVVLVKPAHGSIVSALRAQTIRDYRAHLDQLAAARPNTVTVDWAPVVAEHPEYLDTDGFHLSTPETTPSEDLLAAADGTVNYTDPAAARAFLTMAQQGVESCPNPPE